VLFTPKFDGLARCLFIFREGDIWLASSMNAMRTKLTQQCVEIEHFSFSLLLAVCLRASASQSNRGTESLLNSDAQKEAARCFV
jgi:hypothetical protein